jgi:hypothetical protein
MKLQDFYQKFARLPLEKRNEILRDVRHDPLTMFFIYKQLEHTRAEIRYFKAREEELLRIAEESFNQLENGYNQ